MNRAQRTWHRRLWIGLALMILIVFVAALMARARIDAAFGGG